MRRRPSQRLARRLPRQSAAGTPAADSWVDAGRAWEQWARAQARAPFDLLRQQYAGAVRSGAIRPSLLAAGRFERGVAQWQSLLLGPWARAR